MSDIKKSTMVLFILFAVTLVLGPSGKALATDFPGPDAFGYEGEAIPFNFRDISATGSLLILGDDQVSDSIQLPCIFNFYGLNYAQVSVSSNGFLTFTPTSDSGCCSGDPIPTPAGGNPDNLIAGWWNDLYPPGTGEVRYQTLISAEQTEFVVGFYNMQYCCGGPGDLNFEMILHCGSNNVELQYLSTGIGGSTTSVGIENVDGTIGLQVARGNDIIFNNQGFLLTGPAFNSVPTLSEWGLMAMAGILGLVGFAAIRRKKATA